MSDTSLRNKLEEFTAKHKRRTNLDWSGDGTRDVRRMISSVWESAGPLEVTLGAKPASSRAESIRSLSPKRRPCMSHGFSSSSVQHLPDPACDTDRLRLRKLISQAEKQIMESVKAEFDAKRREFGVHDKLVEKVLEKEIEEKKFEAVLSKTEQEEQLRQANKRLHQQFSGMQAVMNRNKKSSIISQINQAIEENKKKDEEELIKKQQLDNLEGIYKQFMIKYGTILEILQSSNEISISDFQNDVCGLENAKEFILKTIKNCKNSSIKDSDIKMVSEFLPFVDRMEQKLKSVKDELEKAREEKKLMEQADKLAAEARATATGRKNSSMESQETEPSKLSTAVSTSSDKTLGNLLKCYQYIDKKLLEVEKEIEEIKSTKYKKFRKDCGTAVLTPVNAVSCKGGSHLADKLTRLTKVLDGRQVPLPGDGGVFTATSHPSGIKYAQLIAAKRIVKIGEDAVSSNPELAPALASLTVALSMRYPLFTILLQGCIYRSCPYLIPHHPTRVSSESDQHYYERLGYQFDEDGTIEEQDKMLKRISGVARLYGAILVAQRRQADANRPAPLGPALAWQWLSAFLLTEVVSDVSATILLTMIETIGNSMLSHYRTQFQKVLYLCCTDYMNRIKEVTEEGRGAPVQRLKTFLQQIIQTGNIPLPKGHLPPNSW